MTALRETVVIYKVKEVLCLKVTSSLSNHYYKVFIQEDETMFILLQNRESWT